MKSFILFFPPAGRAPGPGARGGLGCPRAGQVTWSSIALRGPGPRRRRRDRSCAVGSCDRVPGQANPRPLRASPPEKKKRGRFGGTIFKGESSSEDLTFCFGGPSSKLKGPGSLETGEALLKGLRVAGGSWFQAIRSPRVLGLWGVLVGVSILAAKREIFSLGSCNLRVGNGVGP